MAEIDWSALQTPDFGGNALRANAAGRVEGLSLAKQNALRQYTTDPDGGIRSLMAVDPATAVTLQKAQAEQRQQASAAQAGQLAAKGDYTGAASAAGAAGNIDLMEKIQQMSKEQRAQASETYAHLASTAQGVSQLPYEQRRAAIQAAKPQLEALGMPADRIDAFDPTDQNIAGLVHGTLSVKDQIDLADKDRTYGLQRDQFGEVVRHNQADEQHSTAQLAETVHHDRADEATSAMSARAAAQNAATNAQKLKLMVDGGGMDPDVVEFYAQRNARDGYVPSLGMGPAAAAIKAQILARSAQLQRGQGQTGADAATTVATTRANSAALSQQTKQQQQVKTAESTANANADLALQTAAAGGAGPSAAIFNRPIQAIRGQMSDPSAARFNAALGTFRDEYANVMTGGGTSGSTDAARREADARINKNMSVQELHATIDQMRKEMANRSKSFEATVGDLRGSIRGGSPAAEAAEPGNAGAVAKARAAIQAGADRNAVIQRLRQHGIDPAGL